MNISLIQSDASFRELRSEWNQLSDSPLSCWDWNYAWWTHMQPSHSELSIVIAKENDKILGIAPFMKESRAGETCLRFLGSGTACTDYARIVCSPDVEAPFLEAISRELRPQGFLSDIRLVELEGIYSAKPVNLSRELDGEFWTYHKPLESTWIIQLSDTWESFVTSRNASLRRKIRKAERRLDQNEFAVRSTRNDLDLATAFTTLVELHQIRFRSKGEPGVFANPRFESFLSEATKRLVPKDNLEIIVIEHNGIPVVAHLYLVSPTGLQMYQSGVRTDAMKLEPGYLMFTYAIRRSIQEGMPSFDFLRGDEPYKKFWGAAPSRLRVTRCVSNRFGSTVKHQAIRTLRQIKNTLRQSSFSQLLNSSAGSTT